MRVGTSPTHGRERLAGAPEEREHPAMLPLRPFKLERYFARHEFSAPHLLCASDCESRTIAELLEVAGVDADTLTSTWLGYTESAGAPALRAAIAARHGDVEAESVVVGAPQELIFLGLSAMVAAGDKVVVSTPCYGSLSEVPHALGAEVTPWEVVEEDDGWRFDLDALEGLLLGASLLVLNTPHNPTGARLDEDELRRVLELCAGRGVRVFCDEMYRGLEPEGVATPPSATDLDPRVVSLGGLSKSHGLPGLRLGWLLCADEPTRARILEGKDYTTICPPAPSEALALVALGCEEVLFADNRARIRRNTDLLISLLEEHGADFSWRAPRAGPIAFVRSRETASVLAERARACGVMLLPSTQMDHGDHHLRFGLGREAFPAALDAWRGALL
jgi:aspartate/methionine/tyrosine aminotransferase